MLLWFCLFVFSSASVLLLTVSAGGLNMHTCIHPSFGNIKVFLVILKYDPTVIYTNQTGCCCHLHYRTMKMDEMFSANGNRKASCPNHYRCVCAGGAIVAGYLCHSKRCLHRRLSVFVTLTM